MDFRETSLSSGPSLLQNLQGLFLPHLVKILLVLARAWITCLHHIFTVLLLHHSENPAVPSDPPEPGLLNFSDR